MNARPMLVDPAAPQKCIVCSMTRAVYEGRCGADFAICTAFEAARHDRSLWVCEEHAAMLARCQQYEREELAARTKADA